MADRLLIHELKANCRVGVYAWEQKQPQPIWIDLELAIDAKRAAARDRVRDAVDYGALVTAVKGLVEGKSYHLVETMAEETAALILKAFSVPEVVVRIKKRALPGVDYAAVEVARRAAARTSRTSSAPPTAERPRRETRGAAFGRR